ncbi:MAG TPA: rod shape-determining protein MreC, partial [Planctomycetota bacterium]|nr:rod shape-determining protein MreC [Planctomycetota bacterium]
MGSRRRKSATWLLVVLSLFLLLLPSGVSQTTRLTALAGFIPLRGLSRWTLRLPGSWGTSSGEAETLRTQNEYLQDQQRKLIQENRRLSLLLDQAMGMKQSIRDQNFRLLAADVVFPTDSSPWRKSLTITFGTRDGAEKDLLVVYNNQVVGRIVETGPWTSRVQTVTDPGFRAGAVAVPKATAAGISFSERHGGVYEGTAGQIGLIKWFGGETPVENGALVLTTEDPVNGVPRGLSLGKVTSVNRGRGALPRADVEPLLDFRSLEHVMILIPPPDFRAAA